MTTEEEFEFLASIYLVVSFPPSRSRPLSPRETTAGHHHHAAGRELGTLRGGCRHHAQ